ncbi:MAG: cysteine hydrolase [Solobacterium sp.]|nr:cysteine hydrolase [Solobacterium sp.]
MKILAVIDMQNDFIDGSLGTKEAEAIVAKVCSMITDPSFDAVYATMDTHPQEYLSTFEGRHLPVEHCIKGTDGWKIHPAVAEALKSRNAEIIEKPTFGSNILVRTIAEREPDEVVFCGLCTDICVISNALMLRAQLPDTEIVCAADACAGTFPDKHDAALAVMQSCQITITQEDK